MKKICLLDFDLTLYPPQIGTLEALDARIDVFIERKLGLDRDASDSMRKRYRDEYGTTLRGLQIHQNIDADEYYDFIHQVPDTCFALPNFELIEWLTRAKWPKFVFTNARGDWVNRGLDIAGIRHIMTEVYDLKFLNWIGKPDLRAYQMVEEALSKRLGCIKEELAIYFFDDSPENLITAFKRGWHCVWIRNGNRDPAFIQTTDGWSILTIENASPLIFAHDAVDSITQWQSPLDA